MGNRLKKLRQRKAEKAKAKRDRPPQKVAANTPRAPIDRGERPTDERAIRGHWVKGDVWVDLAADQIGALLAERKISQAQFDAARAWQDLRRAYLDEMPDLKSYKSCLDGSVPGYDDGDGNREVIARYRAAEARVGRIGMREILHVCENGQRPRKIDVLRAALDALHGH